MELEFVDQLPGKPHHKWRQIVEALLDHEGQWAVVGTAPDKTGTTRIQRLLFPSTQPYVPKDKRLQTAVRGATVYARAIPR